MKVIAPIRRALSAFGKKEQVGPTEIPGGRWKRVVDRAPGDWQRRIRADREDILQLPTAFAAQGMISQDVAKLSVRLKARDPKERIWLDASIDHVDDVLARPNPYQNVRQFIESWIQSKLSNGNTYVLKGRDNQGRIRALYILDPWRVWPMVSPNGSVFYRLDPDNLAGQTQSVIAPAREIIHDRFNTIFHPLVGLSPMHPASLIASLGIEIQERAARFWRNNAAPAGALYVPEGVEQDEVERWKDLWEVNYGGENYGKTAVLAGGLDYKVFGQTAKDSQLIEQLRLTKEEMATVYRIPLYKVNGAATPSTANTGQLDQEYYSNCLQTHIVNLETCLTEGLELGRDYRVDLDENDILRMDPLTKAQVLRERVEGAWWTRNEARREDNLPAKEGGDELLIQEQYWPAAAVANPARGTPSKNSEQAPALTANDNIDPGAAVQDAVLNGAQIAALQQIVLAVAHGEIPVEAAMAMIAASFPLLTQDQVDAIFAPLNGFEPASDEPETAVNDQNVASATERALSAFAKGLLQ